MSDNEIFYDLRLEDKLEKIKFRIWLNEELQIQARDQRDDIVHLYSEEILNLLKYLFFIN